MAKHHFTWSNLADYATRLNPKTRGKNYPSVRKFETQKFTSGENYGQNVIIPYVGTKSLLIGLKAWGRTQASIHNITLLFSDVEILTDNPNNNYKYFQIKYDGKLYWISKLDRNENPLTSRCSCASYFFDFAYYNHQHGCLYGPKPRPFKRKTLTRPPRNPARTPGICKHIYWAWNLLRDSGFTKN